MNQEVFTIKGYDYEFRIAKMNAIEILAFQSQYKFSDFNTSETSIKNVLERIEVNAGGQWISIKMKDREVYTPEDVLNDVQLVLKLMNAFSEKVIKPVFMKSEE